MTMIALIRISKFAVVVLFLVAASCLLAYAYKSSHTCSVCKTHYATQVEVASAPHVLQKGQRLTAADITFVKVPAYFLPSRVLSKEDVPCLVGQQLNNRVEEGALLLPSDFEEPRTRADGSCVNWK
jgi:Flp pilus assembly protein CpaB